jgi:hypothetical protein
LNITFTNISGIEIDLPKPASKFIPKWYKDTDSYINKEKKPDGKGGTNATIKKCIPVYDAMTAGYIITLPADVFVSTKDGFPYYEWSNLGLIDFHPITQAPNYPNNNGFPYAKFINPWAVKTPKGYSVLFVQPFHRESAFTILPGIVDTDTYYAAVNFPFTLNNPNFEGLIPQGTPIAQVIPFKRESWNMKFGLEKDLIEQKNIAAKLRNTFFNRYKDMFWNKKEYK